MINAYEYIESDFDGIKFNKWAWYLKDKRSIKKVKKYFKEACTYTLFSDDKPIAILSFHEYEPTHFDGCILADECFGDNPKYAVMMKKLVNLLIKKYDMKRVQTTSEDSPELNKWHEFLGFSLEKKHCMTHRKKPFNLWSMEWQ